eukprot:gene17408-19151_t
MDSDIHLKYQKLGQEYQKLRAQVSVLKKGVIDEQSNNKSLQEVLKQKDQSLRKYEQEFDSLQFRNDQLSKRVEILQTDLDAWERGGTKSKSHADHKPNEINESVREQELQMKIRENEMLHQQLNDASQQHDLVTTKLSERLEFLEREASNHNKVMDETNARYDRIVERLQEDRAMMEGKIKNQRQLKGAHSEIKSKLEKTTQILNEKVPFDDTAEINLNLLNVPICDRAHQNQARDLVTKFTKYFVDFMSSLSDFHTYQEQRLGIFSSDVKQENLSATNEKLSLHLKENAVTNRQCQQTMEDFNDCLKNECFISLETCSGLQAVSRSFDKCTKYLEKLLPYQILSIEEECRLGTCNENMAKENRQFLKLLKQFSSTFSILARYLALLALFSKSSNLKVKSSDCFKLLNKQIEMLNITSQDMCKTYMEKVKSYHHLPLVTERLKNTDDCIISSLASMATSTEKIVNFFKDNLDFIGRPCGFKRKGCSNGNDQTIIPSVKAFQLKAVDYMQKLRKESAPNSVPYDIAVKNNQTLVTSTESRDTLAEQVSSAREAITKLEQEKQHWILETQLFKAKFEKESQKVTALGEELGKMKTEAIHIRSSSDTIDDALQKEIEIPAQSPVLLRQVSSSSSSSVRTSEQPSFSQPIGTVETWNKERDSGDTDRDYDHEELVKNHLTSRINDLTKQLQSADSKSVTHYAECRALYKQLVLADKSKKRISIDLTNANRQISTLEDDLETTKRSYEDQIKMLSDHLCGMNDKLTSQKDTIDLLSNPNQSTSKRLNLNNNGAKASWTNFSTSSKYLKNSKDSEKQSRLNEEHQNNDTTEDVSSDKKETETTKDGAFARFKDLIKTFGNGCKQLMWIDARKAWATKKKLKRHDYDLTILTREELRHMRQTKKDMIKSLSVALLFFLPFIGYFAPVIGFLFPKRLLSHQFWDLEQRKKFAFEDHVKRSQYYLPLIQEVGWSSKELNNEDLFQLCIKAINGNHITNDDLISQKDIFLNDLMTVEKMPRFHLEKLCKTWLLPVKWYIPSKVLREFLISRIKQIIEDDDAIRRDKIDSLSDICIRQACHARGLDKSSFDVHVMKNWLDDWMCLTHRLEDGNLSLFAHCAVFKTINFGKTLEEKSS